MNAIPNIPRRVVGLRAENYKRLTAVDITPDPDQSLITISGANAQGKSSVLDALWSALESSAAAKSTKTTRPVRDGEKKATVRVDLGDIIVTRTWTAGGTSKLEVTAADGGATYKTPQKLLDGLLGTLSFDPLAFTRMSAKDQVSTLSSMVDLGIDLDANSKQRQDLYAQRTQVGRDRKALGTIPTVNADAPTEEQSATDILAQLRQAQDSNSERARAADYAEQCNRSLYDIERQITELQARRDETQANLDRAMQHLDSTEDINTDDLETALANVEQTNADIRANNEARELARRAQDLDVQYQNLTTDIDKVDREKADALAAAKFPLDGLSFDDDGITYNGVPFGQASAAEQLRVSCALAAAAAPSVRVMRVTDGSLLDSHSRQALADIAAEYDMQIFMELVDESGDIGIVIEDGHVKGDDQ